MALESKRLTAKPSRPRFTRDLVPGSHLLDRLDHGQAWVTATVSDPAGHGKSTRISGTMVQCDRPSAWLSTDEDGDDPVHELDHQ